MSLKSGFFFPSLLYDSRPFLLSFFPLPGGNLSVPTHLLLWSHPQRSREEEEEKKEAPDLMSGQLLGMPIRNRETRFILQTCQFHCSQAFKCLFLILQFPAVPDSGSRRRPIRPRPVHPEDVPRPTPPEAGLRRPLAAGGDVGDRQGHRAAGQHCPPPALRHHHLRHHRARVLRRRAQLHLLRHLRPE